MTHHVNIMFLPQSSLSLGLNIFFDRRQFNDTCTMISSNTKVNSVTNLHIILLIHECTDNQAQLAIKIPHSTLKLEIVVLNELQTKETRYQNQATLCQPTTKYTMLVSMSSQITC